MKDTNAGQKQNTGTGVKTSQIYALMKKAKNYENRIELGRGDPDFDTPEPVLIKTEANLSGSKEPELSCSPCRI